MNKEKLLKQLDWWRKVAHIGSTCKEGNVCDRAYKEIVAILKNQPTITEKDIEGWVDEARERIGTYENWEYLEDVIKEMLTEIGITITEEK